jgi:hypothetical protein
MQPLSLTNVLVEKRTSRSASEETPDILRNPRDLYRVSKTRHWTLSWVRWIQSTPTHTIFLKSIIILWRTRCRSTVNSGNACLQPLLGNATIGGTVVFFGVRSDNDVIQQYRNRRRCFLCGLFPGYIARASTAMMGPPSGAHKSGYGEWHLRGTRATQCLGV